MSSGRCSMRRNLCLTIERTTDLFNAHNCPDFPVRFTAATGARTHEICRRGMVASLGRFECCCGLESPRSGTKAPHATNLPAGTTIGIWMFGFFWTTYREAFVSCWAPDSWRTWEVKNAVLDACTLKTGGGLAKPSLPLQISSRRHDSPRPISTCLEHLDPT